MISRNIIIIQLNESKIKLEIKYLFKKTFGKIRLNPLFKVTISLTFGINYIITENDYLSFFKLFPIKIWYYFLIGRN